MKYKPGTLVVVTNVPPRAVPMVEPGMPALVLQIDEPEALAHAEILGLTKVKIGMFEYWWLEDDLGFSQ